MRDTAKNTLSTYGAGTMKLESLSRLTFTYMFTGVYQTYEGNTYFDTFNLTTHPADTSYDSVARSLHEALTKVYKEKGYFSSLTLISRKEYA